MCSCVHGAREPGLPRNNDVDICSCAVVHAEAVEAARDAELPVEELLALGELFKVFADPSRLRILNALGTGELCVCDISTTLGMSQSAISHQLAFLKRARLVRSRRDGKVIYYALDDDHVGHVVAVAREHVAERKEQR